MRANSGSKQQLRANTQAQRFGPCAGMRICYHVIKAMTAAHHMIIKHDMCLNMDILPALPHFNTRETVARKPGIVVSICTRSQSNQPNKQRRTILLCLSVVWVVAAFIIPRWFLLRPLIATMCVFITFRDSPNKIDTLVSKTLWICN